MRRGRGHFFVGHLREIIIVILFNHNVFFFVSACLFCDRTLCNLMRANETQFELLFQLTKFDWVDQNILQQCNAGATGKSSFYLPKTRPRRAQDAPKTRLEKKRTRRMDRTRTSYKHTYSSTSRLTICAHVIGLYNILKPSPIFTVLEYNVLKPKYTHTHTHN